MSTIALIHHRSQLDPSYAGQNTVSHALESRPDPTQEEVDISASSKPKEAQPGANNDENISLADWYPNDFLGVYPSTSQAPSFLEKYPKTRSSPEPPQTIPDSPHIITVCVQCHRQGIVSGPGTRCPPCVPKKVRKHLSHTFPLILGAALTRSRFNALESRQKPVGQHKDALYKGLAACHAARKDWTVLGQNLDIHVSAISY